MYAGQGTLVNPTAIESGLYFSYRVGGSGADGQGVLPVTYTLNFAILFILLSPYAQMSLYVADRQFYLTDVAANLYRYTPFRKHSCFKRSWEQLYDPSVRIVADVSYGVFLHCSRSSV